MKKFFILPLFALLFGIVAQAQETTIDNTKYECRYLLSYQSDSTDIYSKKSEEFLLKIGSEKSLFVSDNTQKRDSIRISLSKQNNPIINLANVPKSAFSYRIVKDIHNKKITMFDNMLNTFVSYDENTNWNWEISNEKEKIDQLECQIAYINYAGRRFKTWFSTEISIPEGPYKFYGLPGLIIKMQDTKGFYTFELINFKDMSNKKESISIEDRVLNSKRITKKEFLSTKKNYVDNFKQQLMNNGIILDANAIKSFQDRQKKQNNPIELKP